MLRKITILFAAIVMMAGCTKSGQGTIVKTDDGSKVRVEVIADDIVRVSAIPAKASFSDKESLCVIPQSQKVQYSVATKGDDVVISTSALNIFVSKSDGRVTFKDVNGNIISREDHREFSPIEVDGIKAFTVRQVFESPADEAFYGLGQHQADEWNYKGLNEELYQYNTKISVPFIVSTKGYGILWDSYSFCRWGDPRDYEHIGKVFKLYDQDGKEGAITGTYVPAQGEPLVRRETALNQEYLITPDCEKVEGAPDFNFGGSDVTFQGEIEPSESGTFRFHLYYAGYMKVFIDGKEVVPEIWRTAWNPNSHKFAVDLEAGKRVPLRIEWKPDGGVSYCGLRVLSPVAESEQTKMSWWGEMQDQIDYYFVAGENPDAVISGYRTLTGKAPIMPKWAMGYWQSRERYSSQEQLLATLKEFRQRHIPLDNIVQDWQYWEDDQWGSHEFDATRYPDPKGMVDEVHSLNARFMISVWPKFYTNTEHFKELDSKGWIYQTAVKDSVEDWLGYQQSFYDAYAAGARELFWKQMNDHLYPLGIDAWWMDASEPNIHDCTDMDYRKKMAGPTALGPSAQYFNAYALMNAQAIYEGQRSVNPDSRVFLLTRNGFAGLQRYSTASWSGDIGTRWEDMKTQISAGLNFSMSGIPYWTQDVGGFSVENRYYAAQQIFDLTGKENDDLKEWRELNVRWHQMGMFNPLYRAHGQFPFREPWNIAPEGHPAYESIVSCDQMRYALMPYIYTLAARTWFDDYTIMRPLVMDFTSDKTAQMTDDEFLFGDAILVCPVYTYQARSREVYLPEGTWYDLHDSFKCHEGGRTITADAPYSHIPVYARAGQIVPTGPAIESTADAQDGSLTIMVFTGKDASFCLYEDDGISYGYEKGAFCNIPMKWNEAAKSFTLGERSGSYDGMIAERDITVMIVSPSGTETRKAHYSGKEITI